MFRFIPMAAMLVLAALMGVPTMAQQKKETKVVYVNLNEEIKTVEYVKYDNFAIRVPIINGNMPCEIKVGASNEGETDVAFNYKDKVPYDKAKVYQKKPVGGSLAISEKHGDGPEIEVYRCEMYIPVLPKPKL